MPIIAAARTFGCTPPRVSDGDRPICAPKVLRVRLAGIAVRQMDGNSRINQPYPEASADAARDALVQLIGAPETGGAYARGRLRGWQSHVCMVPIAGARRPVMRNGGERHDGTRGSFLARTSVLNWPAHPIAFRR